MYDPYNGMSVNQFREAQRAAAIEKHQTRQRLEAARREMERAEREAARKPPHEEMRNITAELEKQSAGPRTGKPSRCFKSETLLYPAFGYCGLCPRNHRTAHRGRTGAGTVRAKRTAPRRYWQRTAQSERQF